MNSKFLLVLCLHISAIYSAPMQLQMLPIPYGMQSQGYSQQLMPLQNPFFRQAMPNLQTPFMPQQPMMLLVPNPQFLSSPAVMANRLANINEDGSTNNLKSNIGHTEEQKDSVTLEAETNTSEMDLKRAVVLMPNGARLGLGDLISYIPFLPIEINVPDTINWITGLIPWHLFGKQGFQNDNMKRLSNKGPTPVFVIPGAMMPQI